MAQQREPSPELCKNCHARPVYVENWYTHPFCGGTECHGKTGQHTTPSTITPHASPAPTHSGQTCRLSGCMDPVFCAVGRIPSQFCSMKHRRHVEAVKRGDVEACMGCLELPKNVINGRESDFCSKRCSDAVFNSAPIIIEVPKGYRAFQNVETQFISGWKNSTSSPKVMKIWKIFDKVQTDKFRQYKLAVERRTGLESGKIRRRWYGTVRGCELGDDDNNRKLCGRPGCSLCWIILSSFQIAQFSLMTNFLFGGIYTTSISSKANDYVLERKSKYKAMLLSDVVKCKAIKPLEANESLTQPPPVRNPLMSEPGEDLNYDESIVYESDVIRPVYLVIYQ